MKIGTALSGLGFKPYSEVIKTIELPSVDYIKKHSSVRIEKIYEQQKGFQPPRKRRKVKEAWNKFSRRRNKLRAEGRCPKCGKPSAPYYYCPYHREYNRLQSILRKSPLLRGETDEKGLLELRTSMSNTAQSRARLHISANEGSTPSPATTFT